MTVNWNEEESGKAPATELDSLSSYSPSQDTARLESLVDRLEVHVEDKIGLASDGKP